MREWGLTAEAPLTLRIAADARMTVPNYVDDQIWELRLGGGAPPALALETTYGLRAGSMRIFPGFRLDQETWIDPLDFHSPPTMRSILPNYIRLTFEPSVNLSATAEYWVKESNLLAGRLVLYNGGSHALQPETLMHAQLRPDENSQTMTSVSHQGAVVLQGSAGPLAPLLFLSGGSRAAIAPYPALSVQSVLDPGESESFIWVHAACGELQESFTQTREFMSIKWDAEIARVEQANAGLVEVETGNPDWDIALAMAQTSSIAAFVGPTRHLPHASIVQDRSPGQGYSAYPDGRDYDPGWDGVAVPDAYVTILQILPSAPELAQGLLLNYLACQAPDGTIDAKPGLGGQRGGMQCAPLLANIAWQIYLSTEDREFLSEVYPRLLAFFDTWFQEAQDKDQDGFPEWHSAAQSGFDDWPAYGRIQRWGQGLDIALAETPDLSSYLYREIEALVEIGQVLGQTERETDLNSRQMLMREVIERTWSDKESCYLAQDRDLDLTVVGSRLGTGQGDTLIEVGLEFEPPVRVLIRVQDEEKAREGIKISVRGRATKGRKRVHRLNGADLLWVDGFATLTSEATFTRIEQVEVQGLDKNSKTEVRIADFSRPDHTGLLPLWAGVPDNDRANQLIKQAITNERRYWREFGMPNWPADGLAYRHASVQIRPNLMVGESLVNHGYLDEAVELIEHVMKACIHSLREDRAFREAYYPDQPGGQGKLGHSSGVAPLSLFLHVLGVRLISPYKIALRGHNAFSWPVHLSWRGVRIEWNEEEAIVEFPDGGQVKVQGKSVQIVAQVPQL
ncbi:MAG: hypothetical protein ACE5JF_07655 [Anaerolineales bacterium]